MTALQDNRGSSTLFVASFVLPVMFFLGGLSVDMTLYYLQKRNAQAFADEAAVFAQRYLPYQSAAQSSLDGFLAKKPAIAPYLQTSVTADSISIQGLVPAKLIFPRYFGYTEDVPYHLFSRVQNKSADTLILMDVGDYLAPDFPVGTPWGSGVSWPAASFFANTLEILHDANGDGYPEVIDPRLATQQCFNPAFSPIKQAVIDTAAYLSSFHLNAVGVSVFPGNDPFVSELHPIEVAPETNFFGTTQFAPYIAQHMRSSYCAAASDQEVNTPAYQVPQLSSELTGLWSPPPGAPQIVTVPLYDFNSEYQPYLTLAESIWSRTVRKGEIASIADTLSDLRAKLITVSPIEKRGGLVHRATKNAFMFFGDLPHQVGQRFPSAPVQSALSAGINALAQDALNYEKDISLHMIFLRHGNTPTNYASEVGNLKSFVQSIVGAVSQDPVRLRINVLYAPGVSEFRNSLMPVLARQAGSAVLVN